MAMLSRRNKPVATATGGYHRVGEKPREFWRACYAKRAPLQTPWFARRYRALCRLRS